jgi:hypothetical protein
MKKIYFFAFFISPLIISAQKKQPLLVDFVSTMQTMIATRTLLIGEDLVQANYNRQSHRSIAFRVDILKPIDSVFSLGARVAEYKIGTETFFDPRFKANLPPLTHFQGHIETFRIMQVGIGTRINITQLVNRYYAKHLKPTSRLSVNFQLFTGVNIRTMNLDDFVTQRGFIPFFYPHTVVGSNGDIATIDRDYENRAKVNFFVSPELLLRFKLTNKFALQASLLKQFNLGNPLFMHYNSFELNGQTLGRQEIVGPHHSSGFTFGVSYTFLKNKK